MAHATNTHKTLKELLEYVDGERLILPEIQREFIWTRRSVKFLFDSLYRQLPIGHILVWKAKEAVNARRFKHLRRGTLGPAMDGFYGYLLDGQQRLTALGQVREQADDYPLFFYAYPDRAEEGLDYFHWLARWNDGDPWFVPIADVLRGQFNILDYIKKIEKNADFKPEYRDRIHEELVRLTQILDQSIGVIEFESGDYREATELFIRFNSAGRKLNKSDLYTAELALKVKGLTTDRIAKAAHRWPSFRFTMPFLVQCLLAVHTGRLKSKPTEAWGESTDEDVRASWGQTEKGLAEVMRFIVSGKQGASGSGRDGWVCSGPCE